MFNLREFIMGKPIHLRREVKVWVTNISLPDMPNFPKMLHPVEVRINVDTHKRSRWHKTERIVSTITRALNGTSISTGNCDVAKYTSWIEWADVARVLNDKSYRALMIGHAINRFKNYIIKKRRDA